MGKGWVGVEVLQITRGDGDGGDEDEVAAGAKCGAAMAVASYRRATSHAPREGVRWAKGATDLSMKAYPRHKYKLAVQADRD